LEDIHQRGGYYISRVKHNVKIYRTQDSSEAPKCAEDFMKDLVPDRQTHPIYAYSTNTSVKDIAKEAVYPLYSLRWQIEIWFTVWKSIFRIHRVKKMKKERLDGHLYGTFISILISSTMTFKIRNLLYQKEKREISE